MRGKDCDDGEAGCEAGIDVGAGIRVGRTLLETDVLVERRNTRARPNTKIPAYFNIRNGVALRREYLTQGVWLSSDHVLEIELRLLSLMMSAVAEARKSSEGYNGKRRASYGIDRMHRRPGVFFF